MAKSPPEYVGFGMLTPVEIMVLEKLPKHNTGAIVTEKTTVGVAFIPWHFAEAAANLLTNDALDPQALIPEFKACAVQVFPAMEEELANPDVEVRRGRY